MRLRRTLSLEADLMTARHFVIGDLTPPMPDELFTDDDYRIAMQKIERVAEAIATVLSLLPREDRAAVVNAVLRGMEGADV
jgi:hypothetical protein